MRGGGGNFTPADSLNKDDFLLAASRSKLKRRTIYKQNKVNAAGVGVEWGGGGGLFTKSERHVSVFMIWGGGRGGVLSED